MDRPPPILSRGQKLVTLAMTKNRSDPSTSSGIKCYKRKSPQTSSENVKKWLALTYGLDSTALPSPLKVVSVPDYSISGTSSKQYEEIGCNTIPKKNLMNISNYDIDQNRSKTPGTLHTPEPGEDSQINRKVESTTTKGDYLYEDAPLTIPIPRSRNRTLVDEDNDLYDDINILSNGEVPEAKNNSSDVLPPENLGQITRVETSTISGNKNTKNKNTFEMVYCKCGNKCNDLLRDNRERINTRFSKLSWTAQAVFISSNVKRVEVKSHRRTPEDKLRMNVYRYFLNDQPICQRVFAKTLGISQSRVLYTMKQKFRSGIISPDKRGKKIPGNKTNVDQMKRLKTFFNMFPKYRSHYSIESNKIYFHPDLSITKLYGAYIEQNKEINHQSVSKSIFTKTLKAQKISFYVPKKDTCNQCSKYRTDLSNKLSETEKKLIETEKNEHLIKAKAARDALSKAKLEQTEAGYTKLAFSFDLQKTQPIPYLQVNKAYYSRNINLYNLGINPLVGKNCGKMYVWTEMEGKRGSVEVGSAIKHFIENQNFGKYKEIHSFSDGCGGQNKNRNFLCLMEHIVQTTPINKYVHSYLESGHSYLPNDTDFGKIEKKKNTKEFIFDFNHWISLIEECQFEVVHMKDKFIDIGQLAKSHTFRNLNTKNEPFRWQQVKMFKVEAGEKFIGYKTSNKLDEEWKYIDFSSKKSTKGNDSLEIEFETLYNLGLPLEKKKYKDVQSLRQFIPAAYSAYFENIKCAGDENNDIEYLPDELMEEE